MQCHMGTVPQKCSSIREHQHKGSKCFVKFISLLFSSTFHQFQREHFKRNILQEQIEINVSFCSWQKFFKHIFICVICYTVAMVQQIVNIKFAQCPRKCFPLCESLSLSI